MSKHRKPRRVLPIAIADGMLLCAAGLAIAATHVAPDARAAADEQPTPVVSEPIASGGIGGPLYAPLPTTQSVSGQPLQATIDSAPQTRTGQGNTTWTHTTPAPQRSTPSHSTSSSTPPPATTTTPAPQTTDSSTPSPASSTPSAGNPTAPASQPSPSSDSSASSTPSPPPTSLPSSTESTPPSDGLPTLPPSFAEQVAAPTPVAPVTDSTGG